MKSLKSGSAIFLCLLISVFSTGCLRQQTHYVNEITPITQIFLNNEGWFNSISGNILVGREKSRNYQIDTADDIFGFDIVSNTRFSICVSRRNQINPQICGNIVVWQDDRYGDFDIFAYDLRSKTEFPICIAPGNQITPKVSKDYIVWQNDLAYLYYFDLTTHETNSISSQYLKHVYSRDQTFVFDLDGHTIAWINDGDVFIYDLSKKEESLISDKGIKSYVKISGDILVWMDITPTSSLWTQTSKGYLAFYNLQTKKERFLPKTTSKIFNYDVDGEYIIWKDDRNNKPTVYAYDLVNDQEFLVDTGSPVNIDNNIAFWNAGDNSIKVSKLSRILK